ncbi:MAG: hypothetical protein EA427_04375 [Spirochaetaceae bacterium]|nr:MAG: hypothetical protein EA427_04375 [Spirochaetaceae bacterium]
MDNDRKVNPSEPGSERSTDIVERSKMVFLREIVNEFKRRQQQYDLETEFAKTKRNRSVVIPLAVVGLILIFGVVVAGVTRYIQSSSLAITVDIDDFADVNLRDILDEAQRLQNQLEVAQRELRDLQEQRDVQIRQFERARDREIGLLAESPLGSAARTAREQELRNEAEQQIAAVRVETEPAIQELQERIADLQDRIAQYDSRQLEQAREQEEILNNQQRLFELEMAEVRDRYERQIERLTSDYEREISELEQFQAEFERTIRMRHSEELARLRARHADEIAALTLSFNPRMDGEALQPLLDAAPPAGITAFTGPGPFRPVLQEEGAASPGDYRAVQRQYEDFLLLLDRMRAIPFQNSVPPLLEQLDFRARDLVRQYDRIWRALGDSVQERDGIIARRDETIENQQLAIDRYNFSLNELSRFQGDTGYVIDPRDPEAVVVYVNPILTVVPGMVGYVFRRDDEFVGTIRFTGGAGGFTARVEETVEELEIRAFDKVLIEVQGGE